MALLNYTSSIEPEITISEIQKMLSRHGVTAMMMQYDGPQIAAVAFEIKVSGKPISFRLPCNWRAIKQMFDEDPNMRKNARMKKGETTWENQAVRTAWKIIRDWVQAQLALVEVNMVSLPQVFLPYAIMKDDRTLFEHVATDPNFLLGDGDK